VQPRFIHHGGPRWIKRSSLGCWAQHGCLAWSGENTDHVRLSQARRQARSAAVVGRSPVPTADVVRAGGGGAGTRRGAGPSGGRQAPAAVWLEGEYARAGSTAQAGGWWRGTATRGQGAAWARGAWSYAMSGLASAALRGGMRRGLAAAGRAAVSPMPQQGQASAGGPRAAGWSSTARWCHAPFTPGPYAASVARVHSPPGVAASCGQGGARGGGGRRHREARAPASVSSHPTRVCRRRRTASARPSLRLLAAPET
jgi:hypothetical protein